jgi:FAD/FMN-containing dehydrogenase
VLTADTLAELKAAVGDGAWLDAHEDLSAYTVDFRRLYRGVTPLVLLPRSVDQVSRVLTDLQPRARGRGAPRRQHQLLRRRDPDESGSQIVLSMQR